MNSEITYFDPWSGRRGSRESASARVLKDRSLLSSTV